MKKSNYIKSIIIYYVIGIVVEMIIKSLLKYDFQGLIVHGLPLVVTYFKINKSGINVAFLQQKKPIKGRFSTLFAIFGFTVLAESIAYQVLLFTVEILKLDRYSEFMERLTILFSEQNVDFSFFQIIILIISSSILGPILEEILLRGFIYDYLKERTPKFDIYLNTILFGLIHGGILPQYYISGYVYTKLRENDGDVYGVIILHMFNNFLVDLQYLIPRTTEVIIWSSIIYFFIFLTKKKISKRIFA